MKPELAAQLLQLVTVYEKRVTKNRAAFKVEVHIPLDDLAVLLQLARVALGKPGGTVHHGDSAKCPSVVAGDATRCPGHQS